MIHFRLPLSQSHLRIHDVFPPAHNMPSRCCSSPMEMTTLLLWKSLKSVRCQHHLVMHPVFHDHLCHPQCLRPGIFSIHHCQLLHLLARIDRCHLPLGLPVLHWAHHQLVVLHQNLFLHSRFPFQICILLQ
jgi:hypothetical protein